VRQNAPFCKKKSKNQVAAAHVYNSLSKHVTSAPSLAVFWSRLKTYLFCIFYSVFRSLYSAQPVQWLSLLWTLSVAYLWGVTCRGFRWRWKFAVMYTILLSERLKFMYNGQFIPMTPTRFELSCVMPRCEQNCRHNSTQLNSTQLNSELSCVGIQ